MPAELDSTSTDQTKATNVTPLHPTQEGPAEAEEGSSRLRKVVIGLLVLAVIVLGVLLGLQVRENGHLADRVVRLSGALYAAQADIAAHERHLGVVRERVSGIAQQIGSLESLVQQDPTQPPSPATDDRAGASAPR